MRKNEADGEEKNKCSFHFSISAAVTATDELLMAGGLDGVLRAYNAHTGEIVWQTETAKAFDTSMSGLGWVVFIAVWFFAISTMISWSYYGEQASVYLFGQGSVTPYRVIYCLLAVIACSGIVKTVTELDNISALGAGMMLWVNIPVTLILGYSAISAYKAYIARLKAGEFE
jgi:Na+/alanine symporter